MGYTSSPQSGLHYSHSQSASYDNGLWCDSDASHTHHQHQHQHPQHHQYNCTCRSSPALVSLGHQLQNALAALSHHHPHSSHPRHPNQHADPDATACSLYKRISELSGVIQSVFFFLFLPCHCFVMSGNGVILVPGSLIRPSCFCVPSVISSRSPSCVRPTTRPPRASPLPFLVLLFSRAHVSVLGMTLLTRCTDRPLVSRSRSRP